MNKNKHIQTVFFFSILLATLVLLFLVFRPFIYSLIFAGVLAVIFGPLERQILKLLGNRKGITAFVATFIAFFVIIIPLVFFGTQIFSQGQDLYTLLTKNGTDKALNAIQSVLEGMFPSLSFNLSVYAQQFSGWVVQNIGPIFSGVTQAISGVLISFLALFFFFKDGEKFKEALYAYSPLDDRYDKQIVHTLSQTTRSVVKGTLIVALLQGIFAGIGFWIFGIPSFALWGLVTVVAALIPLVGTMLVVLPATIYLAIVGSPFLAIGMFLWGAVFVAQIDNVLRPMLVEREVKIHPFLIFLSVIGGLQLFGPMGFILGPVVLSLLFTLFNIYESISQDGK